MHIPRNELAVYFMVVLICALGFYSYVDSLWTDIAFKCTGEPEHTVEFDVNKERVYDFVETADVVMSYNSNLCTGFVAEMSGALVLSGERHDIPSTLMAHVMGWESGYQKVEGRDGEKGYGQIMERTADFVAGNLKQEGNDVHGWSSFEHADTWDIQVGAEVTAWYLSYQKELWDGDVYTMILAYNAGQNNVRKHGGTLPESWNGPHRYADAMVSQYGEQL